ncbi:MAG: UDP-2,3-diacylglucosamine diphosphatase LpxI [Alphaproteobacteria bacterium]|nr:UDP-2,3-diacylglucosamine diphosphatase LpxI [Alphaproteobacteria bacterium]
MLTITIMIKKQDKKIAIVAGALRLPFLVRDALRARGWDVFVIGLKNFYDAKLNPDMVIRIGGAGAAIRAARHRGIKNVIFVGAIGHPNLSDLRPDLWTFFALLKILKNQRGYDSMAVALNKIMTNAGFNVVAAQDLAPELTFEKSGVMTRKKPTTADKKNIERAIDVSHTIGAADIGASVVVDKQVIAVEAAEGTAKMLERVVDMRLGRKKNGGVFAKMTKPGQDLTIDIPAIGVDTVNAVADAKLNGIVVNTKTCFVVDKDLVIKTANKRGIFIIAVDQ